MTDDNLEEKNPKKDYSIPISIFLSSLILASAWIYTKGLNTTENSQLSAIVSEQLVETAELPVVWKDLGKQMIEAGVIDAEKFESLYSGRSGLTKEMKELLYGSDNGNLIISEENSGFLLNLLWALGLGNKNDILEKGPMSDLRYGGAGNFASTGGWTLAKGDAMEHYSKHQFMKLNPSQQALVERVSKNIYRPCCGNSTYFPDCNHGMAMLGFLELMVSQGASEEEMYKSALVLNTFWFPDTYSAIKQYLAQKGLDWNKISPQELLGSDFSSGSGYQKILSELKSFQPKNSGGCGVDAGLPAPKSSSGCGV
ncbi:MAG: hypothetical protein Q7S73_01980 [bacterium]|nr:hypothetical protein [bacterium]